MTESLRPAAAPRGLTDTALKGIAVVSMVLDLIYYFFGYTGCIPTWCSMVGRLAAPPVPVLPGGGLCPHQQPEKVFLPGLGSRRPHGTAPVFHAVRRLVHPAGRLLPGKLHAVHLCPAAALLPGL